MSEKREEANRGNAVYNGNISESEHDCPDTTRFHCNICLDQVIDPVVTRCGHLYCWPCLYQWLQPGMTAAEEQYLQSGNHSILWDWEESTTRRNSPVPSARRSCPVCKTNCPVRSVIPMYVREDVPSQRKLTEPSSTAHESKESLSSANNSSSSVDTYPTDDSLTQTSVHSGLRRRILPTQRSEISNVPISEESDARNLVWNSLPARPVPPTFPTPSQPVSHSTHDSRGRNVSTSSAPASSSSSSPSPSEFQVMGSNVHASLFQALFGLHMNVASHMGPSQHQQQHRPSSHSRDVASRHSHSSTETVRHHIPPLHHRSSWSSGVDSHPSHASHPEDTDHVVSHPDLSPEHRDPTSGMSTRSTTTSGDVPWQDPSVRRQDTDPSRGEAYRDLGYDFPEDGTTEFLSRLLLLLGSFVILCLLLF